MPLAIPDVSSAAVGRFLLVDLQERLGNGALTQVADSGALCDAIEAVKTVEVGW